MIIMLGSATKKRFKVTEKLIKELLLCFPNEAMIEIKKIKFLNLKRAYIDTNAKTLKYKLLFKEVAGGFWFYTKGFYEELCKNEINPVATKFFLE